MNWSIKIKNDSIIALAACCIVLFQPLNYFIHAFKALFGIQIPYSTETFTIIALFLVGVSFLLNFTKGAKILSALILPAIITFLYFIAVYSLGSHSTYLEDSVFEKMFLFCIPSYIAVRMLDNYSAFYKLLKAACYLIFISETLTIVLGLVAPQYAITTDYQTTSYNLIIPFIFFTCDEKPSKPEKILAIAALILLLLFGGRGPIICALICVLYKMLVNMRKNKLWIFLIIIVGVGILVFYETLIDNVVYLSNKFGFDGSIIYYFSRGDVFSDSGRNDIYISTWNMIMDKPLTGWGLGSTRYYLGVYGFKYGNYPHNIILEFFCDYGFIIGSIFSFVLIKKIIRAFSQSRKNPHKAALFNVCFFSTGFLILLFSTSYLLSPLFFAMLAVMDNKDMIKDQ